jgi:hypothetical protein
MSEASELASTGPRTKAGKAKSSRNATKHGLTSELVLAPGEDLGELEAFTDRLAASLAPVGEREALLVERVVSCAWRLRRVPRLEAAYSAHNVERTANDSSKPYGAMWSEGLSAQGVEGHFVEKQANVLVNLTRYEAALERSMYRALHELERAQAARQGERVALPAMLDVTVSASPDET